MFNKVILLGHLTRDVEMKYLNSGSIATTGIATNRRFKRQDGSPAESTCFVDITFFGRTAEVASQYLKKGSKVMVEGRLDFQTWQDQSGAKRSKHSVVVESLQMVDSRPQGQQGGGYGQTDYQGRDFGGGGYGGYGDFRQPSAYPEPPLGQPMGAAPMHGFQPPHMEPMSDAMQSNMPSQSGVMPGKTMPISQATEMQNNIASHTSGAYAQQESESPMKQNQNPYQDLPEIEVDKDDIPF